jgi:hypothetical protein
MGTAVACWLFDSISSRRQPKKEPWGTYAIFKDSEGNRFVVSPA